MNMNEYGFIYVRDSIQYQRDNVYKIGITQDLLHREITYKTSEYNKGWFILAIQIPSELLHDIDMKLKSQLKEYNTNKGGGTEFYTRELVIEFLIQFIHDENIEHKILNKSQIYNSEKTDILYNWIQKGNLKNNFIDRIYASYIDDVIENRLDEIEFTKILKKRFGKITDTYFVWDKHKINIFFQTK
jgi:hypothetical protein